MRRVWLTIFLALALAVGGVANATASSACPMRAAGELSQHEGCHENSAPVDEGPGDMSGCMVGMACRSAPAVAPTLAPLTLSEAAILL